MRFILGLASLMALVSASKLVDADPHEMSSYEPFGGADAAILRSPADWNRNTYPIFMHCTYEYLCSAQRLRA